MVCIRKERAKRAKWEDIGFITVDSGRCWIGDPCYVLKAGEPESLEKAWDQVCQQVEKFTDGQINHGNGNPGMGVSVATGGDGIYNVQVKRDADGAVTEMRIRFA